MVKALALEVARELGKPPEKVYEICKSFHDGLRLLMLEPEKCKNGIMIKDFLVFEFKEVQLKKSILRNGTGDPVLKEQIINNIKTNRLKNPYHVKKEQAES